MKQIYHFDKAAPPALSEKTLRAELERRKLKRQAVILALAGAIANGCLFAISAALLSVNPALSFACFVYACIATFGGGAIAIVFSLKRRSLV